MAGKRHHTIPQLLQRGFASRICDDEFFVWQYRGRQPGFEVNIKNVSVERFFYGKPEETDLDERITAIEDELARSVHQLREVATGTPQPVDGPVASRLVAHFALRTQQMRAGIDDMMKWTTNILDRDKQDPTVAIEIFLRSIATDPTALEAMAKDALINQNCPPERIDEAVAYIAPRLPELLKAAVLAPNSPYKKIVGSYFENFRERLPVAGAHGRQHALSNNLRAAERVALYKSFRWYSRTTTEPLILGDCVCLFETSGERRFRPIDLGIGELITIFLPLAAHVLLFGTRSLPAPLRVPQINRAAARCSRSFFISSQPLPTDSHLIRAQGQWSGVVHEREVERVLANALRGS
jgi:hypothetical protein